MTFLNNAKLIKLGNDSEVLFMKLDGVIVYQKGLPLYIPYEYRSRNDIIEVKTMVTKAHPDLSFMFYYSTNLTTVDTSNWDTSNVTTMRNMFSGCEDLKTLDTSNWDTSKVTDIKVMFSGCDSLTTLDLSNWDTSNVTDMGSVFYDCSKLTTLDLSNWDTGNVTTMECMFLGCFKLISVGDISNWDTSKVTDMQSMFYGCEFETLDLSGWNTSNVTNMMGMFTGCDKLQELNLSGWNMSSVNTSAYDGGTVYNYANSMFYKCASLHTLRLDNCSKKTISKIINSSSLPTGEITDSEGNIITRKIYCKEEDAAGLTEPYGWMFVDVTPYKVGKFANNTSITEVETTVNNTCTDLSNMFYWCSNLTTVNTTEWDTSNVTTMANMFYRCIKLTSLDLDNFDTSNVTDMHGMFEACDLLDTLSIANFDTSKVTNMSYMFHNCHSLTTLDLSHFDTSKVTNMCKMFDSCDALTALHLGYYWDMSKVADTRSMFYNCKRLYLLNLQNCSKDTITKIITSEGFPTGTVDDVPGAGTVTRKLYCKQIDAPDESLLPDGWQLIPVD